MSKLKINRVERYGRRKGRQIAVGAACALVVMSIFGAGTTKRGTTFQPVMSAHAQEHVHSRVSPAPIVDGSQQPELIPDDFAIRALMETLQVAPNADEAALKQLRSRVRRVNLSEDDIEILVRELGMFDTHVKAQQLKALSFRPSPTANRVAIDLYAEEQAKLNALIVDHYEQLLSSLSSDGAAKLRNHLLHVKSRMKVYPRPDMAVSGN